MKLIIKKMSEIIEDNMNQNGSKVFDITRNWNINLEKCGIQENPDFKKMIHKVEDNKEKDIIAILTLSNNNETFIRNIIHCNSTIEYIRSHAEIVGYTLFKLEDDLNIQLCKSEDNNKYALLEVDNDFKIYNTFELTKIDYLDFIDQLGTLEEYIGYDYLSEIMNWAKDIGDKHPNNAYKRLMDQLEQMRK